MHKRNYLGQGFPNWWYICLSEGASNRRKNMFIHYSLQIIYIYMNLSEPFRVTNGVRPGGVLRPYFFAVY